LIVSIGSDISFRYKLKITASDNYFRGLFILSITDVLIMRQIVSCLFAGLIFVLFASACHSSEVSENTQLLTLISQNEDPLMIPIDLAFFLATHNYDATPKDGYVEVKLNGVVYKAVPNGYDPGLADLIIND
jgi:hypothetical protein